MARIAAALCDAPEIGAQNKFLRRNICPVDAPAYSPYQQLRIAVRSVAALPVSAKRLLNH
jgi:hypothetical protein